MKTRIVNISEILKHPNLSLNPKDYMKTKRNRDDVDHYHSRLVGKVLDYLKANNIGLLNFNEDFCVYAETFKFDDDEAMAKELVCSLDSDGNLYTSSTRTNNNISLYTISVYEVAYILDLIESNCFEVESNISDE